MRIAAQLGRKMPLSLTRLLRARSISKDVSTIMYAMSLFVLLIQHICKWPFFMKVAMLDVCGVHTHSLIRLTVVSSKLDEPGGAFNETIIWPLESLHATPLDEFGSLTLMSGLLN